MRKWLAYIALLAVLLPGSVLAATIGRDGLGFECSEGTLDGIDCCNFVTLTDSQIDGATRPMRVAECLDGETFFVRIPFFPDTAGINWQVQADCSLNYNDSAECCFDVSSSVSPMSTSTEVQMPTTSFGGAIQLTWAATIDVSPPYDDWIRSSAITLQPYNILTGQACVAGATCRKSPVWLKFTRDDSNSGCDPPIAGVKNVVSTVIVTTD